MAHKAVSIVSGKRVNHRRAGRFLDVYKNGRSVVGSNKPQRDELSRDTNGTVGKKIQGVFLMACNRPRLFE
jgi:hypothetical protein